MRISVATTTINVPFLLEEYVKHADFFTELTGHEVIFVISGDRKTPKDAETYIYQLQQKCKSELIYLGVEDQIEFLKDFKILATHLDWDCIQRRNVSGLYSLKVKSDVVIYIDDDNYIMGGNYFTDHLNNLLSEGMQTISSKTGFYNIMSSASGKNVGEWLFPRGYPLGQRNSKPQFEVIPNTNPIGVNAGLWIEDPDIDAISRITARPIVEDYQIEKSFCLSIGTWTPLNSQNTSFLSNLLPAYFLSSKVGRYDDIYAGYILQKVMNTLGYVASFGFPIVKQLRNEHDLFIDLENEFRGMRYIDSIVEFIKNIEISGSNVFEVCEKVILEMNTLVNSLPKKSEFATELKNIQLGNLLWLDACSKYF